MSTPVPQADTAFDLSAVRTGQPVASAGLSRWSEELAYLLGYNLHVVGGAQIPARTAGRTSLTGLTYRARVPYARSPGAQVARVCVELAPSDETETQQITVTLPTGAAWVDAQGLDGTVDFPNPPKGRTVGQELVGWVDVSGVDETDLTLSFVFKTAPAATKGAGLRRVQVAEVPLASLNPVASEPVLDGASVRPGRLVVDGSASTADGMRRVIYLLDRARAEMRQHFCLAGVESTDTNGAATTPHWHREASSYGAIDWCWAGGSGDLAIYLHPRKLYDSTASTTWKLVVRYRTSNGAACSLRLYAEAGTLSTTTHAWTAASAATPQDVALPGTSGTWAWVSADVTLPGDFDEDSAGVAGHLVRVWFEAKGPGSGQLLSLATIGGIENGS